MSARIAPRSDKMNVGFSPHLPKFERQVKRKDKKGPAGPEETEADPLAPPAGFGASEARGSLPPETIFEAALLANQQAGRPLSPYEVAQRISRKWSPPASAFPLADKTI